MFYRYSYVKSHVIPTAALLPSAIGSQTRALRFPDDCDGPMSTSRHFSLFSNRLRSFETTSSAGILVRSSSVWSRRPAVALPSGSDMPISTAVATVLPLLSTRLKSSINDVTAEWQHAEHHAAHQEVASNGSAQADWRLNLGLHPPSSLVRVKPKYYIPLAIIQSESTRDLGI